MTRFLHAISVLGVLAILSSCGGDGSEPGDGGLDGGTRTDGATRDGASADSGGGSDAGASDGGTSDAGEVDGGDMDAGAIDGGDTDGGALDGGGADAGAFDGGAMDGGPAPTVPKVYLVRRDTRRCIYPLCGGFWLHAVNEPTTTCADGTTDVECYVAEIDWTALGLTADEVVEVQGSAGNLLVEGIGELRTIGAFTLGALVANAAWRAEWATREIMAGTTTYYAVRDNGMLCLVPPCFSLELDVLNTGGADTVSALDLGGTGASAADIARGTAAAGTGDLRVLGTISTDPTPGPSGAFGRTLDAQQFFLPVR
jgi:hypothetical protein